MRVLVLHNRYRELGGEDAVANSEVQLLRRNGVEVRFINPGNEADPRVDLRGALALAFDSHWSRRQYDSIRALCREFRPHVAHVHNFWMRLTPAVHAACRDENVPTVQTLHNFRLFCANAQFQRNGHKCQDCLGRTPWRGVWLRCYRHSFLASASVVRMIATNRARKTWTEQVSAFICVSEHARRLSVAGGIPEERIQVKPNFVEDRGLPRTPPSASNVFLLVGRLSAEKGVSSLLQAWKAADLNGEARLLIAGDGPLRSELEREAVRIGIQDSVSFTGFLARDRVLSLLGDARAIIIPSLFHECFPRVLVESMSAGRPLIASNVGALDELVESDIGLQFEAGDPERMAEAIRRLWRDPGQADRFGRAARARYLERYTPEHNFEALMKIYDFAMGRPEHCSLGATA